jgi:uncharacterized integral membrane protein
MKAKTIIIVVLIALFVIILLQNTEVVTFQLLFWKIGMSRIILLFFMLLIGFISGYITARITRKKNKE